MGELTGDQAGQGIGQVVSLPTKNGVKAGKN
jgi:hypothetical protein